MWGACWAVVLAATAVAGCGGRSTPDATAPQNATGAHQVQAPPPPPSKAQGAAPGETNDPDSAGTLVVSRELVQACPELQLVKAAQSEIEPDMVWLVVLDSLADCMNTTLRTRKVTVTGGQEQREIVKHVLQAKGVDLTRVAFGSSYEQRVLLTLAPEGSST